MRTQRTNRNALLGALAAATLLLALAAPAHAAPQWRIVPLTNPSAAPVDDPATEAQDNLLYYFFDVRNFGDAPAPEAPAGDGTNCDQGGAAPQNCIRIAVDFPPGIAPSSVAVFYDELTKEVPCEPIDGPAGLVTCRLPGEAADQQVSPTHHAEIGGKIVAEVTGAPGIHTTSFEVSGAGAGIDTALHSLRVDPAPPGFDVAKFDAQIAAGASGVHSAQAGAHPYDFTTSLEVESFTDSSPFHSEEIFPKVLFPVEAPKDIVVDLPAGFIGNPTIAERCTTVELSNTAGERDQAPLCPVGSQLGTIRIRTANGFRSFLGPFPLFNMEPPVGIPSRFGFNFQGTVVMLDAKLRTEPDYGITVVAHNIVQALAIQGSEVTVWGVPSDQSHDPQRACPGDQGPAATGITCPTSAPQVPFFRNPTSCTPKGEGLPFSVRADSWQDPGDFKSDSFETHEPIGYPAHPSLWGPERGTEDCDKVPFDAKLEAQPTSIDTETASGLEVHVEIPDPHPGPESPDGIANSDIKKVKVTLPQGMTINPSQAEGLGVCSPSQYDSTELTLTGTKGGCPDDSKIGTVLVKTPLLEETIPGTVFIARQDDPSTTQPGAENPFDSLLALYVVLAEPKRGILIKLPGKVETDERSGRILTTFDDLPQLPFESFDFKFREGARAPLVTPPTCGTYETDAEFTAWSTVDPVTGAVDPADVLRTSSTFEIARGIGGGPCPPAGLPGFNPGFQAGTINNDAGSFSPTTMRLTRLDGEQNLTKFSATLAPGLLAKLAGVENCSDAAIAAAKAPGRTGKEELASPSCPQGSKIGRTLAGAGVGSVLTHVPGSLYLAGPYKGAPLSVVSITPAVAGPFDVGVVVIREALSLDPVTGVASVDGAASDPIPHILKGIPLKLRDLRVYVDRENFTLNPTSCDPSQIAARLWGSAADVFNPADDVALDRAARFQAADCASLGFKPKLSLKLRGGSKRGAHPALKAVYKPRPGDANLQRTVVKLPRSAFLDQAHIRTICTRVQFAQGNCPKGAIYGKVTAFSPLLDEPLRGPAYLRSSDNQLPDLVFDLKGLVEIETSARIDSIRGGIRATFPFVPDAPLTKVVVEMQGGRKGLIQNSRNLCASTSRAEVKLDGHNGKASDSRPVVKPRCGKRGGARR